MQAWHMRHAIHDIGHSCSVINYMHPVHMTSNKVCNSIRNLGDLKARLHWMIKTKPFQEPIRSLSDDPFTDDVNQVPWNRYSGIVVGSDVVFDFQNPKFGSDRAYFGACPAQQDLPFMSYAASCGMAEVDGEIPEFCSSLRRFSTIGVRDEATSRLVNRVTGRRPAMNLDPTWLSEDPVADDWKRPRGRYVLLYGRRLPPEWAAQLTSFCRKKNFRIVSAGNPDKAADEVHRRLTPFQWVDLFRRAEATIVGTLHGTMYSIKYNKPFILINNDVIRQKVKDAVDLTGMGFRRVEQHELTPNLIELLEPGAGVLPEIPKALRKESLEFLRNGVSGMLSNG